MQEATVEVTQHRMKAGIPTAPASSTEVNAAVLGTLPQAAVVKIQCNLHPHPAINKTVWGEKTKNFIWKLDSSRNLNYNWDIHS